MIDKEKVKEIIKDLTKSKKDFEEVIQSCTSQYELVKSSTLKTCAVHCGYFVSILENLIDKDKPVVFEFKLQ